MSEGIVEPERYIVYNLFPVGKQSVLTAFKDLIPPKNPSVDQLASAEAAADKEKRKLSETNPHVFNSFEELVGGYTQKKAKQMFLGALICHRALREEAKSRGGALPTFTEQFVQDYDIEQDRKAQEEINDKQQLIDIKVIGIKEITRQVRRNNIFNFRNLEPEFSEIVEKKKLGVQSGWLPEEDYRYTGIIYLHSLFKAGFSNPKNFKDLFSP